MQMMKKIGRFLSSMQFAVILLVILAATCSAGSFIPQGQSYEWYAAQYSERTAALIRWLYLDDAFHSWWFVLISAFLCLNLLLCNLLRFPQLVRRCRREADPAQFFGGLAADGIADPGVFFAAMHFSGPKPAVTREGRERLFARRNLAGLWGAWTCHLGILLLIAGFSLGQLTKKEYTVYGVPGQTRQIGDTAFFLTIDDFTVGLREDDTVSQYTAEITVTEDPERSGRSEARRESAEISVNHPASLFGMKYYQNSTGWAAKVHITQNGQDLQDVVLCAGEYVPVENKPELVILLNAFYPDYVKDESGMPKTASGQLRNPAYLYTVYYQGSVLGMNVLLQEEELTIDDYVVTFSEPQNYTLIQIKKDSFISLALAGGLLTMLGLFLAFYLLPAKACAEKAEDGSWRVTAEGSKGGAIFREQFLEAVRKAGGTAGVADRAEETEPTEKKGEAEETESTKKTVEAEVAESTKKTVRPK